LKFKKELDDKNPSLLQRQKDEQFQQAFKELWPNTYHRINDKETNSTAILEQLNRQKIFYNSLIAHDINQVKKFVCKDCNDVCYLNPLQTIPKCYCQTVVQIDTPAPTCKHIHVAQQSYLPKQTFQITDLSYARQPNLVSGYDMPYLSAVQKEDLVKSSYNKDYISNDVRLLKSIRDDNEKLRLHNKIEKTNDLVDDIIGKVSVLQADIKKKSAEMKIKEDMLKLKEEYYRIKREPSLKSILKNRPRSKSPVCRHERSSSASRRAKSPSNHHHHYYDSKNENSSSESILKNRPRSKSPVCRHERSSSASRRAQTPNNHHHHHYDSKNEISCSEYDDDDVRRNRFWKSWKDVPPRVDSWNCDWNVY
jgi:hypothetical protein